MTGTQVAIAGGLGIGLVFGATVQRSGFCMMGAVADLATNGDRRRMRAWMLTIALAIVLTQGVAMLTPLDLESAAFLGPRIPLAGLVLGGLAFGFGMVIACGCPSRSLVNLAAGDLRALVTLLILAVLGYAAMRGILSYPRLWLQDVLGLELTATGQGLHQVLAGAATPGALAHAIGVAVTAVPLAAFALARRGLAGQRSLVVAATIIAACIAAGWYVTGVLAADDFEPVPVVTLRFVAPTGDSLLYLMVWSGSSATFGIASVGGVLLGAFASAVAAGRFRWQAFEDLHDFSRYAVGGALMGVGGVLCLGCTVGQGLGGVSTLAIGSFVALASIIAGGVLGVRYLETGSLPGAVRAALGRA